MALRSILLLVSWLFCILIGYKSRDFAGSGRRQIPVTFVYNRTFSSSPSPESNQAWGELFPDGDGFFRTSPLVISSYSVFHQLHCLDKLRQVTYDLLTRSSSTYSGKKDDAGLKQATDEAMHCFDYLRQNIQCTADDTLEKVIPELGGVSGWDTLHYCHDFESLRQKASALGSSPLSAARSP